MSIFDESEVVAGHQRLATLVLDQHGALVACTNLIREGVQKSQGLQLKDKLARESWLAASHLVLRICNDAGASSVMIDRGYFLQAAAPLRSIAETAQLLLVFSDDPSHIESWRLLRGIDRYNRYGHGKLKSKLRTPDLRDKFDWFEERFDTFSEYGGHPSAASIMAHRDGNQLHIGPHVNEFLYTATYKDLASLVWHATDVCRLLWEASIDVPFQNLLTEERKLFLDAWPAIAPPNTATPKAGET
ncbi:DUF5677 domain-containing protein [Hoeflea sp. AS16]|uniref:DUF5677 domain-containing protein n=1 Tax=Hoeflea sp. AS16 TaxID=3135779 RepID=UPI00319D9777